MFPNQFCGKTVEHCHHVAACQMGPPQTHTLFFFLVGMTFSFPVLVVLVVVMVVVLVVAMVVGTGDGVTRSNKQSSSDMTAASEQQFPPLAI